MCYGFRAKVNEILQNAVKIVQTRDHIQAIQSVYHHIIIDANKERLHF